MLSSFDIFEIDFKNRSMKRILILVAILMISSCSPKLFKEKWTEEKAPVTFKARFETTQGNFEIEAKREWSPKGVDRLYQLIKNEFYTDVAIFRVVPNFVAQFGIHNDSIVNKGWNGVGVEDEPVVISNTKGTVTSGMENVLKFYDKHGNKLGMKQDSIGKFGNKFLREKYPEIDYIIKAYILK